MTRRAGGRNQAIFVKYGLKECLVFAVQITHPSLKLRYFRVIFRDLWLGTLAISLFHFPLSRVETLTTISKE